ncbi:hypothetical protein Tco_0428437 [Tanacetum coccineum]
MVLMLERCMSKKSVKANKEISRKISELGCPEEEIDNEKRDAIDRKESRIDLMRSGGKLLAQTKSQNSVIESQNRTIASLNKKVEELENMVGGFRDELKLFQTMFQGAWRASSICFSFRTQAVSHEGYTGYGKKKKKHSSQKN